MSGEIDGGETVIQYVVNKKGNDPTICFSLLQLLQIFVFLFYLLQTDQPIKRKQLSMWVA